MILPASRLSRNASMPPEASAGGLFRFLSRKLRLGERLGRVVDGRVRSRVRVPLEAALLALVGGFILGVGSVRGVEDRLRRSAGFRRFAGWGGGISDDTLREVLTRLDGASLQAVLHDVGRWALRRWGAGRYLESELARRLAPLGAQGLAARAVVALDGHETFCSQKLACALCRTRKKQVKRGGKLVWVTERYHYLVVAQWIGAHPAPVLDAEPVRPGEGEWTAAQRLLPRLGEVYGGSVGTLVADANFDHEPFRRLARQHGFATVVRHKDANRYPGGDLKARLDVRDPGREQPDGRRRDRSNGCQYEYWVEQEAHGGRRYVEVRRSGGDRPTTVGGCVTDLPAEKAPALAVGYVMETRWWIENTGFHELSGQFGFDRALVHHNRATGAWACALLGLLAYNAWQLYLYRELRLDPMRPSRSWAELRRDLWESLHTLTRAGLAWPEARAP
jgi:hypothetical protein